MGLNFETDFPIYFFMPPLPPKLLPTPYSPLALTTPLTPFHCCCPPAPRHHEQHGGSANNHHQDSDHNPAPPHAPVGFYMSTFDDADHHHQNDDANNEYDNNNDNNSNNSSSSCSSGGGSNGGEMDVDAMGSRSDATSNDGNGAAPKIGDDHQALIPDLLTVAERGELDLNWSGNHILFSSFEGTVKSSIKTLSWDVMVAFEICWRSVCGLNSPRIRGLPGQVTALSLPVSF